MTAPVRTCELIEADDERCGGAVEYRCTPWTTEGDFDAVCERLVCGDAEHLLQMIGELIANGAASVDVAAVIR